MSTNKCPIKSPLVNYGYDTHLIRTNEFSGGKYENNKDNLPNASVTNRMLHKVNFYAELKLV